jgi:hypothetical protein
MALWMVVIPWLAFPFAAGAADGPNSDKQSPNPFFWHVHGKSNSGYILGVVYSMDKDVYRPYWI